MGFLIDFTENDYDEGDYYEVWFPEMTERAQEIMYELEKSYSETQQ